MGKTKKGAAQKRRPYLQLTRRGTYGGLLLIVLACAWMFFVGVLVGRGTSPIQFDMEALSRELEALKKSSEARRRQQLESYAAALEDQSTLDVYAELKRSDDKVTIDPDLSRQVPAPSDRKAIAEPARPADPAAIPVIRRREGLRVKAPGRIKPQVRPGAVGKPLTATGGEGARAAAGQHGRLTLQVAAVKDAQVAQQMVARLRKQGFDAYHSTAKAAGQQGTWHRVRVGRYADPQAAASTMRRLEGQGLNPILLAY